MTDSAEASKIPLLANFLTLLTLYSCLSIAPFLKPTAMSSAVMNNGPGPAQQQGLYSQSSMDSLNSLPATAAQARAFTASSSLSFPGGTETLQTTPSKDGSSTSVPNSVPGTATGPAAAATESAATAVQTVGASGIVPTLQ